MKKLLFFAVIIIALVSLTGCMQYGTGTSTGYIYAVDDGILWDKVWFKPSLESTESDCYLVAEDSPLKSELAQVDANEQIKITYSRHFMTAALCPEGTGTDDEIISFERINGQTGTSTKASQ